MTTRPRHQLLRPAQAAPQACRDCGFDAYRSFETYECEHEQGHPEVIVCLREECPPALSTRHYTVALCNRHWREREEYGRAMAEKFPELFGDCADAD
jgi:hypothetical protein